jgi:hypothetical protein
MFNVHRKLQGQVRYAPLEIDNTQALILHTTETNHTDCATVMPSVRQTPLCTTGSHLQCIVRNSQHNNFIQFNIHSKLQSSISTLKLAWN